MEEVIRDIETISNTYNDYSIDEKPKYLNNLQILILKYFVIQGEFKTGEKIETSLEAKKEVEVLQQSKLEAIKVEDYETAIVLRDTQKELRKKVLTFYQIMDFYHRSKTQKDDQEDKSMINILRLVRSEILDNLIKSGSEDLHFNILIWKRMLRASIIKSQNILSDQLKAIPGQKWAFHNIDINISEFKKDFRRVLGNSHFFQKSCLESQKFLAYFRYYLLNFDLYLVIAEEEKRLNFIRKEKGFINEFLDFIRSFSDSKLFNLYNQFLSSVGVKKSINDLELIEEDGLKKSFGKLIEQIRRR